jgi:hypothetical protein
MKTGKASASKLRFWENKTELRQQKNIESKIITGGENVFFIETRFNRRKIPAIGEAFVGGKNSILDETGSDTFVQMLKQ